ncbi:F0F1 ATP synthase subunit B [Niveispirillum sp.]|uniref:F0F1 ATP synthase subunit B family protein n=1 Tax=Niveispirillum sp. TaxID=1917217 RepID=UPI001B7296EF|nr:F0F1 ATP synthase subunit B [Niveispirillum sp.]MBP7336813.1 F0F1 ATP synthase subunit B [Niveispirillum sp.]
MHLDSTFWYAVAFVIFVVVVARLAGKGILAGLDGRSKRIADELEQAQRLREDAQAALAQFQRKQRDALKEAEAILTQAREEAARLRAHAAADLEASLKRREQQAVDKIAQAEALAIQQVRDLAVEIAVQATEKLLVQNVDEARNSVLVDAAISELPSKLH